ncbi:MAG TPA: tRNA pseudouridine synthase A [Myxococcales bacterium]|nr:tRNA pseudouridine synthase A [Myxococcales bacterium]
MNYALLLAYDGAAFRGWQKHPGLVTVQGMLEDAIGNVVHGASRTDAGVHALGQVASFRRGRPIDLDGLALPESLRVLRWAEVNDSFHARSSSTGKRYRYDFAGLQEKNNSFLGTPDWESARAALRGLEHLPELPGLGSPSKDRRPAPPLTRWSLSDEGVLDLEAPAFRKHQVRNMAGHVLAVALGYSKPESLRELAQRNRPWMGACAPAHGLTLMQVLYPAEIDPFR